MLSSSLSSLGGPSPLDKLVNQLIALERRPVVNLEIQKSDLTVRKAIFSDLDSKLSTLQTRSKNLAESVQSFAVLQSKAVTSSNTGVVTGSAASSAASGTATLFVSQLAKQSTQVSNQFTSTGGALLASAGAGTHSFDVTVNGTVTPVQVTVSAGEDDRTILQNIASAINNAMAGVTDSVTAVAIDDTSSTTKLTITSDATGLANKVSIADVSGTLISASGVGATTAATDTAGGFVFADTALDAGFTLNGINITRGSNTITDVLQGVTLTLNATQAAGDAPATLTIGADTATIRGEVDGFINEYNDALKFLNLKTTATADARGELAGDFTFRNLLVQMRTIVASGVSGVSDPTMDRLSLVGIAAADDGTLSVEDDSKLDTAIQSGALAELFNTPSTGIGNQLDTLIDGFVITGGIISDEQSIVDSRTSSIDNRIKTLNVRIDKKAEQLRNQFSSLQGSILLLQGQAASFSAINNLFG